MRRRNIIEPRDVSWILVVSTLAGIAAAACDVSPTGSSVPDALVTFAFAAFVAWASASAPWWALTAAGALAMIGVGLSPWIVPALAAVAVGLWLGVVRISLPWARSAAGGCVVVSLLNLGAGWSFDSVLFGASAIVTGLIAIALAVVGLSRRDREVRRRTMWGAVGVAVCAVVALAGLGAGAFQARNELRSGYDHLNDGLDQLRGGDTQAAAATLDQAATELRAAASDVNAAWAKPAGLIPFVAQHRSVLLDVVDGAADSASAASAALLAADIDQLRVENGTVDVETLAVLAEPLAQLNEAVVSMDATLRDASSPWLLGVVRGALADGRDEIDRALDQSAATAAAAEHLPAMLGIDDPRSYLVVFTSPGEARGQSGLVGNWAEITITDGHISQTGFGRTSQLIDGLGSNLILDGSDEFFDRYGPFGAGSAGQPVVPKFWSNVTMSPDTPTVASVMAQMYAAAGFGEVDGVLVLDPKGLAALLRVAGPISLADVQAAIDANLDDAPVLTDITTVAGLPPELDADTLERFLLVDQYTLDEFTRRDLLEAFAGATIQRFLTATLPTAQDVAATLGPAATEGHIVGWARRADEQELFRLVGMAGRLPAPDGRDGLAIVTNNASGNKIDSFLERSVSYDAEYDTSTGAVSSTAVVTLHNTAPTAGYPDYVIGNIVGLPIGTNRTLLTVYSPLISESASLDDVDVEIVSGTELGWNTATVAIDLAPGESRTVRLTLRGAISADDYSFVWRPQPLTRPDSLHVETTTTGGETVIEFDGTIQRLSIIDHEGVSALR